VELPDVDERAEPGTAHRYSDGGRFVGDGAVAGKQDCKRSITAQGPGIAAASAAGRAGIHSLQTYDFAPFARLRDNQTGSPEFVVENDCLRKRFVELRSGG